MMVVTVEVWPGGRNSSPRVVETLFIGNVSSLSDVSNYDVYDQNPYSSTRPDPVATITGHRRRDGALELVRRCAQAVDYSRRRTMNSTEAHRESRTRL